MSKNHKDFVVYVRNGVGFNALVAVSQEVYTPATQFEPATNVEHLTLVYLDASGDTPRPTGDQLRNSIKVEFSVPPLTENKINGWKDVVSTEVEQVKPESDGSGTERWGGSDWTAAGEDATGFPVPKGSPTDVTSSVEGHPAGAYQADGSIVGSHAKSDAGSGPVNDPEFVQTDPEAYKAFLGDREASDETATEYQQVLKENADASKSKAFPSGDGRLLSGKGPNPPAPGSDPSIVDNPAPASPKDEAHEQGPVVGEAV